MSSTLSLRLIAVLIGCSGALAAEVRISSPDGRMEFKLDAGPKGSLAFSVTMKGTPVILPSPFGITVDKVSLSDGAEIGKVEQYRVDETYPWNGPHSTATDRCNGARIAATHTRSGVAYTIEVRVYDDGIAFRHIVPGGGSRVPDEATVFRLPPGSTLWFHDLEDHYEAQHARKSLRAVAPGAWLAPPVTFMLPEGRGYGSISEGALTNYSGMALQGDGNGGLHARLGHAVPPSYPFRLRYPDLVERYKQPAAIAGTIETPWRVVMAGPDLNTLVNSDIVHNVAAKPDPKLFPKGIHTDWVKPGRSLWSYLDGGDNSIEGMKAWARLAKQLGFEYNVLEGFWVRWPESDLRELAEYSRELGVKLLIWKHSNTLRTPEARQAFFDLCSRVGVAGAKIDFFDHEHKDVIDLYEQLLRGAAEHKLLIDFHGCNKPTGLERTWPNLIGFEGVRGMEMSAPYAKHEVTLPFTRMLAGLADYTPMHFSGRKLADTTWAHQVANAVILQAPLLVFAAHPANILENPALELVTSISSTWDETVALPISEVGAVAAIARRKGTMWFLAVNNGPVARTVRIDLSFLGQGSFTSMLVRDASAPDQVKIEHMTLRREDPLYVEMRSGGGFVARFTR